MPIVALLLALLAALLPATAFAGGWTTMKRVTDERSSRLDSLHQLSADRGTAAPGAPAHR